MQGYITLATGSAFYLEMAVNLVLSTKYNDPLRPVCLVTDREMTIPDAYRSFIDHIAIIDPKPGFFGCLNKLRINEASPYDETMFVDSDCILVKNDMDRHWNKFQCPGFSIAGDKVAKGHWYNFAIEDVISKLDIQYLVKMNSGVFYFRAGKEAADFFQTALNLVEEHKNLLGSFHRNKLQLADEPFIGATMGKLAIEPISYEAAEGTIMMTTWNASCEAFDPISRESSIVKHGDFALLDRFFPRHRVLHSPSFAHFVKLKPKALYNKISNQLRDHFGVPRFRF